MLYKRGPVLSLYAITISILASPFISIGGLQLWMLVPVFVLLINWKNLAKIFRQPSILSIFLVYTLVMFIINYVLNSAGLFDSFLKQLLFTSSFLCFFLVLSYEEYFTWNHAALVKFLNTVVFIACLYGIYQSIGRIFGWPLTGSEYLDFRKGKIAGLIQISSFFKEPALFSQFLLCVFFIHAFVLKFKYKWVLALILINIVLTISVSGYISILVLIFIWLCTSSSKVFATGRIKKKFIFVGVIMLIGVVFFMQTELFGYIFERFSSLFKFVNPEFGGQSDGSVDNRTDREVEFAKATLNSHHAFTGFGIDYSEYLPDRTLALNGIAEVIIRWGIIGVLLFLGGLLYQIITRNKENSFLLMIFIILYITLDGAIAKPAFWMFLGLVFLFNQIKFKHLKINR